MNTNKPHKVLQSWVNEDMENQYKDMIVNHNEILEAMNYVAKAIIPLTMHRKMGLMTDRYDNYDHSMFGKDTGKSLSEVQSLDPELRSTWKEMKIGGKVVEYLSMVK